MEAPFFDVYYMPRRELSAHTQYFHSILFFFSFNSIILRAYYMLGPMLNSGDKGGDMNRGTNLMKLTVRDANRQQSSSYTIK